MPESSGRRFGPSWALVLLGLLAADVRAQSAPARVTLEAIAALDNSAPIGYAVIAVDAANGAQPGDPELCRWALNDWIAHADDRLAVFPADESEALIRVFIVPPGSGQYGVMRPIEVKGRRGAAVYVRPDTDSLDPVLARAVRADPLLRETIVYLTCLHELGHALGLEHTAEFADVMYYFGYGGDIEAFFGRYRSRLTSRADIETTSGLSKGDVAQLLAAYPTD